MANIRLVVNGVFVEEKGDSLPVILLALEHGLVLVGPNFLTVLEFLGRLLDLFFHDELVGDVQLGLLRLGFFVSGQRN